MLVTKEIKLVYHSSCIASWLDHNSGMLMYPDNKEIPIEIT